MSIGFLKLHRKLLEWEWYSDINVSRLFIHLLLKANFEDKKWQGKVIKRGELVTSLSNLANETNLTIQQVRTAINKLKSTHEITSKTTNQFTYISLCNYSIYQDKNDSENKPINTRNNKRTTNEQQTNNKPITTTKEDNKLRIKESNPPTPLSQDSTEPKKDDDFLERAKERFKSKEPEKMKDALKILEFATEDAKDYLDMTSHELHHARFFYELLLEGFTSHQIGLAIVGVCENLKKNNQKKSIKTWNYFKPEIIKFKRKSL